MNVNAKKTLKFAVGVCAALGAVALGAVVASGSAFKVVAESLNAAKNTMKKTMAEMKSEDKKDAAPAATDMPLTAEANVEVSPADFEEEVSEN